MSCAEKYVFKPYSKNFPSLFSCEKARIARSIAECLDIQHVGSTAIPGLGGKGIIDIAIAVRRGDFETVSRKLAELGYDLREHRSTEERRFLRADLPDGEETIRRYHIHLTFPESGDWRDLIAFRDYLRRHPREAEKYAQLKKEAAILANGDGSEYRRLKSPFFQTHS